MRDGVRLFTSVYVPKGMSVTYPILVDRNPQTFVNIPDAKSSDFRRATERVYRGKGKPSGVIVQVLE